MCENISADLLKKNIQTRADELIEELIELSAFLHAHPEPAYHEEESSAYIVQLMKEHGLVVTYPYGGVPTSFRVDMPGSGEGPTVAILAEYDALQECGHGCGHNIIASAAVGAFLALQPLQKCFPGRVALIGTPAEECGGGKIRLLENGAFSDISYALMIHPGNQPLLACPAKAATRLHVIYNGQAAHSADASKGVNALSAMRALYMLIDIMRPTMPPGGNVNGSLSEGGSVGNIICGHAESDFSLRANTLNDLEKVVAMARRCAEAAALATGAEVKMDCEPFYAERYSNRPLDDAFQLNMARLGVTMKEPDPDKQYGSSDAGNLSIHMPLIHEYLPIAPEDVPGHSKEFAKAAISPQGNNACILGAKGLAMTALDILLNADLQKESYAFFEKQIPACYKKSVKE